MGTRLRTTLAVLALLGLAGVLAAAVHHGAIGRPVPGVEDLRTWLILVPPVVAMGGLLTGRTWSRWAGIATGIAVLPWAAVLTLDRWPGGPLPIASLVAALLLILVLSGKSMIGHYEGRAGAGEWTGARMRWLRWAMICNLASAFGLLAFVAAYDFAVDRYLVSFITLMAGLLLGIVLLARQKTAGLLLVWLCCLLFLPVGFLFVRASTTSAAEMALFAAFFLPGLLTGWATAFVFGRPVWRFLRS